jgi:hypothetical protein
MRSAVIRHQSCIRARPRSARSTCITEGPSVRPASVTSAKRACAASGRRHRQLQQAASREILSRGHADAQEHGVRGAHRVEQALHLLAAQAVSNCGCARSPYWSTSCRATSSDSGVEATG